MKELTFKKSAIIFIHMLIGWALCGATIGVGRSITSMENTLIIHALAVPVIFGSISLIYFTKFNYTRPLATALVFMFFAIIMDAGIIAPFAEKSFDMFKSILGTWIPFGLIFLSTLTIGKIKNP